jgi:hypothetical protein
MESNTLAKVYFLLQTGRTDECLNEIGRILEQKDQLSSDSDFLEINKYEAYCLYQRGEKATAIERLNSLLEESNHYFDGQSGKNRLICDIAEDLVTLLNDEDEAERFLAKLVHPLERREQIVAESILCLIDLRRDDLSALAPALALIERMEQIDELVPELIAEIGKFSPESWRMIVASMIRMKVNLEDTDDGKVLKEMMDQCGF